MWRNYSRFVYLSDVGQVCMAMASTVLFKGQSCTCLLGTRGTHCTPFIGLHAHIHTSHGQPSHVCPNAWRYLTLRHSRGNASLLCAACGGAHSDWHGCLGCGICLLSACVPCGYDQCMRVVLPMFVLSPMQSRRCCMLLHRILSSGRLKLHVSHTPPVHHVLQSGSITVL